MPGAQRTAPTARSRPTIWSRSGSSAVVAKPSPAGSVTRRSASGRSGAGTSIDRPSEPGPGRLRGREYQPDGRIVAARPPLDPRQRQQPRHRPHQARGGGDPDDRLDILVRDRRLLGQEGAPLRAHLEALPAGTPPPPPPPHRGGGAGGGCGVVVAVPPLFVFVFFFVFFLFPGGMARVAPLR